MNKKFPESNGPGRYVAPWAEQVQICSPLSLLNDSDLEDFVDTGVDIQW